MERRQHFSLWYFLIVFFAMTLLQSVLFARHVETLAYSDFKTLLRARKIKDVVITAEAVSGTADLRGANTLFPKEVSDPFPRYNLEPPPFATARVPDNDLVADLQTGLVSVTMAGLRLPRSCIHFLPTTV